MGLGVLLKMCVHKHFFKADKTEILSMHTDRPRTYVFKVRNFAPGSLPVVHALVEAIH